jgi:hypothetical protein
VEGNVVTTEVEYRMRFHGERRGRANKDWIKALVFFAIQALLCCTWFACRGAYASDSQVIVEGARGAGDAIRTSGHNVPLLRALEEVVPASYSVNVPNAGPWADVPVSWQAGGSLVHVLGEILSVNPSLQAHIDTDLALVTVSARAHSQADDPVPAASPSIPAAASMAAAATVVPAPAAQDLGARANSPLAPPSPQTVAAVTKAPTPSSTPSTAVPPTPSVPPIISVSSATAPDSGTATSLPTAHAHSHVAPTDSAPVLPIAVAAPPPAQTQATALEPAEVQTEWQMRPSDGSVRNALARWAKEAGWQFVWDVPTDFAIDATATVHGTLEEALRQVVEALAGSAVPIQAVMYKRNRVLRVIAKGAN